MMEGVACVALLAEGVDRNFCTKALRGRSRSSPSSRRAWIEICKKGLKFLLKNVALLAEGVDRNKTLRVITATIEVALLAEGVDRNWALVRAVMALFVALLAEGVDRNPLISSTQTGGLGRPPRGGRG